MEPESQSTWIFNDLVGHEIDRLHKRVAELEAYNRYLETKNKELELAVCDQEKLQDKAKQLMRVNFELVVENQQLDSTADAIRRLLPVLESKQKEMEAENRELEAENAQLRDSIVQMVRRMQEVVTWNELDAPRRREDDDE